VNRARNVTAARPSPNRARVLADVARIDQARAVVAYFGCDLFRYYAKLRP
jgi:hypothetical protein